MTWFSAITEHTGHKDLFFTDITKSEITIASSACLLGDNVRYDGKSKPHNLIKDFLSDYCSIIKICPEVGAGLNTPRPAVQLIKTDTIEARGVEDNSLNVTNQIQHFSIETIKNQPPPTAFIFKSRSPSCGFGSTPVFNRHNEIIGYDKGLFAHTISHAWTESVFLEEENLKTAEDCFDLLFRCAILLDIKQTFEIDSKSLLDHYKNFFPEVSNKQQLIKVVCNIKKPLISQRLF